VEIFKLWFQGFLGGGGEIMLREISLFLYYFLTGSHQAIKLRTHRDKILFSLKKKRGSQSHCVENKYYYSIDYSSQKYS
jgi:hypothetical protein